MSTPLDVYFVPMVTVGLASDLDPKAKDPNAVSAQLAGLLFLEAAAPQGTPATGVTPFEQLTRALLAWALSVDAATGSTTLGNLRTVLGVDPATGSATGSNLPAPRPASAFADVVTFLAGAFTFALRGPKDLAAKKPAPASLAIFPMFPHLALTAGGGAPVDFGTPKLSTPPYQTFLAQYFQKLAPTGVSRPSTRSNVPAQPQTESLAQSIFADYFQILVRQVTSDAAQWVQAQWVQAQKKGPPAPADAAATLAALAKGGAFNVAAGFVSRFLLHGLRIPDPADTSRLRPIFALTGQAWAAPAVPADPSKLVYGMTLGLSSAPGKVTPPAGLFANLASPLAIDLADVQAAQASGSLEGIYLVKAYEGLFTPPPNASPPSDPVGLAASVARLAPFDAYTIAPRRFALATPSAWQRKGTATQLGSFTDPLRTQIDQSLTDLRASVVSRSAPITTAPAPIPAASVTWATRLDFTLRQATATDGAGASVAGVYELHGASQADRDDLFALLSYLYGRTQPVPGVTVELLYATSPGPGLTSDPGPSASVLKANLATNTTTSAGVVLAAADLAKNALGFLTLLWESATVDGGGYYLAYAKQDGTSLPATLFQSGAAATLTVVVTVADVAKVALFHNAVILPASGMPDDPVFAIEPVPAAVPGGSTLQSLAGAGADVGPLGEANATTALLPTGTSITVKGKPWTVLQGDTLLRIALALNVTPADVARAVAGVPLTSGVALQMAPVWVTRRATLAPGNTGFELLRQNPMPAASTVAKDQLGAKAQLATMFTLLGNWVEQAGGFAETAEGLPVGPIDGDANATPGAYWTYRRVLALPQIAQGNGLPFGPYTGVGSFARIAVIWHDIFGNRVAGDTTATPLDIPIGYRDPLVPLAQWPAVRALYTLTGQAGAAALTVQLGLDLSRYDCPPPQKGPWGAALVLQRATTDSARLAQIYFQLAQPNVSVAVTCTIDNGATHVLPDAEVGKIKTFVQSLKSFVDKVVAASGVPDPSAAPNPATLAPIAIAPAYPAALIFPLDVQLVVTRSAGIDPYFASEPGSAGVPSPIARVASSVRPALDALDDGTIPVPPPPPAPPALPPAPPPLTLGPFAARLERLFPGLKLASGTADDGSGKLYAVQIQDVVAQGVKLGYAFPAAGAAVNACFFAPAPLATAPWSSTDVDIAPYDPVNGDPKTHLGAPVKQSFRGIDLDAWAAGLLRAVDRVLSAPYAVALRRLDSGSYDTLVGAKKTLADAIAKRVTSIVGGDGDLAAAQDALRQQLLVSIADAYRVDAIVQVPVTVTGPGDHYRLSFQPKGTIPVPAGATLASLAGMLLVPLELLVALVAGDPGLLASGFAASFQGKSHTVAAGESLRVVAAALGTDEQTLGAALAVKLGLVRAGADLGVIKRTYALSRGDTLRTVLDFLAPEVMASGDPTDAIDDFLDLNHATPGILAVGATFVHAGTKVTVVQGETFDSLTARLFKDQAASPSQQGSDEAALVREQLDTPDLLGFSEDPSPPIVVSMLARVPAHALSRAEVDVTGAGSSAQHVTFVLEMASHAELANLPVTLSFTLDRVEYAFSPDVSWAPGFEEASALHFVLPITDSVGVVDIPIPLRVYPPLPVVSEHSIVQTLPAPPAQPTIAELRAYAYDLVYSYARAAQDRVTLSFAYNQLVIDDPPPPAATDSTLDHALAQYASIAPALDEALAALPSLDPGDAAAAKTATTAVQAFAQQVAAVAAQWTTWQGTTQTALPAASFAVRVTTDAAGHPRLAMMPMSVSSGPAPAVTPAGFAPVFQHAGVQQFAPLAGVAPMTDQFHVEQPGLDVMVQQSAWGSVTVTRNESLLPGQQTNGAFVYRLANVRAYSPAVPLVTYREPLDMASVSPPGTTLAGRLSAFFRALLTPPASLSGQPPPVWLRVAVSFGTLLAGSPSAKVGSKANIVSLLPALMSPAFLFDLQGDLDLSKPTGFCVSTAAQMTRFLEDNHPAQGGARWVFDVTVYSSLDAGPARPLIELTDVQLLVADSV